MHIYIYIQIYINTNKYNNDIHIFSSIPGSPQNPWNFLGGAAGRLGGSSSIKPKWASGYFRKPFPPKKTAVNSHSALLGGLFFFGVKVLPSKKKRSHVLGARPSGGWPNPNPPFAPHFAPAGTLAVSDLDPHSVVLHLSLVLTPWRLGMDSKWNELSASWWFTNFGPNGLRRSVCHVFSPMFRSEEKKPAIDKSYTFVCRTSFSMAGSSRTVVLHLHLRWAHLGATSDLAVQVGRWFESTR